MIRRLTVETVCLEILLFSMSAAFVTWLWGMCRKSFGAIPSLQWLVLAAVSLVCTATIGILEFTR